MENLKQLLTPIEEATTRISSQNKPTASYILPMLQRFINHDLVVQDGDSPLIRKAKESMRSDPSKRYQKEGERRLSVD